MYVDYVRVYANQYTVMPNSTYMSSTYGQPVTAMVSVIPPGAGTPTGIVTFQDNGTSIGTAALTSGQMATFSGLGAGLHSITAIYGGDSNFAGQLTWSAAEQAITANTTLVSPSRYGTGDSTAGNYPLVDPNLVSSQSAVLTQTVSQASSTTTVVQQSVTTKNETFTATVAGQYGGTATGTVTFYEGATSLGTGLVSAATNQATCTISTLAAGTHSIKVAYSGDTNLAGSTSSPVTETIYSAGTAVTVTSSVQSQLYGQNVTLTATVSAVAGAGAGPPTGVVTFVDNGSSLGTGLLNGNATTDTATFTTSTLPVGNDTITASYSGDGNFNSSTSTTSLTETIVVGYSEVDPYIPMCAAVTNAGNKDNCWMLNYGEQYRIRQNGSITEIEACVTGSSLPTTFYVQIWRSDYATNPSFTLVGQSDNIASSLVLNQLTTVSLASPITGVHEGDYYACYVAGGSGLYVATGQGAVTLYSTTSQPGSPYSWLSSATAALGSAQRSVELFMNTTNTVFIGDSIIAGYPYSSLIENPPVTSQTTTAQLAGTIADQYGVDSSFTFQNMGWSGQTTAQILSRFSTDAVNLHPNWILLEGGVNDVRGGLSQATIVANWTAMLNAASSAGISVGMLLILPATSLSNAQCTEVDSTNAALVTLAASYPNVVVVDARPLVGTFRSGGPAGNLWNQQTQYDYDDLHYNSAGSGVIAGAIYAAGVGRISSAAGTTATVLSGANTSVYGQSVTFTATVGITSPGAGHANGRCHIQGWQHVDWYGNASWRHHGDVHVEQPDRGHAHHQRRLWRRHEFQRQHGS